MSEETNERLDRIAAILTIAHCNAIADAKRGIRADKLKAAILDAYPRDWAAASDIWTKMSKSSDVSKRTFEGRLAELVAEGGLWRQGNGSPVKYLPIGLV